MKLNSISPQTEAFYSRKNTFKASPYLRAEAGKLVQEAKNFNKMNVPIDKNALVSFVKRIANDMKVIIDSRLASFNYAVFEQGILFKKDAEPELLEPELYVSPRVLNNGTSENKIYNIAVLIHELVHYFDHKPLNPDSIVKARKEYLDKSQGLTPKALMKIDLIFDAMQSDLQDMLHEIIPYNDTKPRTIRYDENIFDAISNYFYSMPLENLLEAKYLSNLDSSVDKKSLYKLLARLAEAEYDAYKYQTDFQKECLGLKDFTDVEYRNLIYKKLKDIFTAKASK